MYFYRKRYKLLFNYVFYLYFDEYLMIKIFMIKILIMISQLGSLYESLLFLDTELKNKKIK